MINWHGPDKVWEIEGDTEGPGFGQAGVGEWGKLPAVPQVTFVKDTLGTTHKAGEFSSLKNEAMDVTLRSREMLGVGVQRTDCRVWRML